MQNGNYRIKLKGLGTEYTLKSYNGSLRVHDKETDIFIRRITPFYLSEFYEVGKQAISPEPKLYNISWIVNGIIKEVIQMNASYAVCAHKVNELARTTHKSGKLLIKQIE